ncbi:hypothetical protein [Demequina salsinemoris]|uniref:hypothetical protein n=1 Tax=Demequina salsinemoris TaxID=577470 RepID=UPI000B08960E|nr:hypothetical protein [Demequina salsinemoris]
MTDTRIVLAGASARHRIVPRACPAPGFRAHRIVPVTRELPPFPAVLALPLKENQP